MQLLNTSFKYISIPDNCFNSIDKLDRTFGIPIEGNSPDPEVPVCGMLPAPGIPVCGMSPAPGIPVCGMSPDPGIPVCETSK